MIQEIKECNFECKGGTLDSHRGFLALVVRTEQLQAENKKLKTERNILALLSSDTPKFFNPMDVMEAKKLRDRILKGG